MTRGHGAKTRLCPPYGWLDLLAGGMPEAELRSEYPQLTHDDVLAAIAYGAEASRERVIPVSVEPAA
jgi:uncharacterized protein (DUF433 family)